MASREAGAGGADLSAVLGPLVVIGKVGAGDEDSSALPGLVLDGREGVGNGSPLETREKMSDRELGVIL